MIASQASAREGPTRPGSPLVWIVVLNWNGLADTEECLQSLCRLRYSNTRTLVVDNGSRGGDADRICEMFPHVLVHRAPENLGYAGGNNVGIRLALKAGADYTWLLNNDTIVEPESLSQLVEVAERNPRVGLLSPVIYNHDQPHSIQFCGTIIDHQTQRQTTLTSLADSQAAAKNDSLALWGTALLLKRTLIDTIGLFDERYFAYQEDLDYSLRAIEAGFDTAVVAEASVLHKSGRSLGSPESPLKEYLVVRNWYYLWRSHVKGRGRFGCWRHYLAWSIDRALSAKEAGNRALAEHALDGIWDASRGRFGSWEGKGGMPQPLKRLLLDGLLGWHPDLWISVLAHGPQEVLCRLARRRRNSS